MKNMRIRFSLALLIISAFILSAGPFSNRVSAAWPDPVRGRHAMVASQHELASKVGVDIMKRGGNAVDAAIAIGLALAVVYPEAGNIGGGGFMLIRTKSGETHALDYREMAPAAAGQEIVFAEPRLYGGSAVNTGADGGEV